MPNKPATATPVNDAARQQNRAAVAPAALAGSFRLDNWTVHPALNRLQRNGDSVALEPKVMALLVFLAERTGTLVTRQELDAAIWPGTVVGYDALTSAVQKLRKAFDDDPHHPGIVETVSKKGYRLIAPVERMQPLERDHATPNRPIDTATGGGSRAVRLTVGLALAASMLLAGILWLTVQDSADNDAAGFVTTTHSLAVLPFENLSGDPSQAYFADGITDDLTTGLARHRDLLVIARDSSFVYRHPSRSLQQIANHLAVGHILHGSVRRSGERLWINARLIDGASGRLLWAGSYESLLDDVFDLESRIASEVAGTLTAAVATAEKVSAPHQQTGSADAYDELLRGREYFYLYAGKDHNLKARAYFESAVQEDPGYALAHAMLAWTYAYDAMNGWSEDRKADLGHALELTSRAIALNADLPVAWFVSGLAHRELGEYIMALVDAEKAIEYDPGYANARVLVATLLVAAGRPEEGLARIRQAMRINPHHPFNYSLHLGQALYVLGRYDEAVAALGQGVGTNPASQRLHVWLAAAHAQAGNSESAAWEVEQILTLDPDFSLRRFEDTLPLKSPSDRERVLAGLRRAGLT